MNKFVALILGTVAAVLFAAAATAAPVANPNADPAAAAAGYVVADNRSGEWESVFLRYSLQLKRDIASSEQLHSGLEHFCNELYDQSLQYLNQAERYQFMILQYDRYEALKVSLYCEHISIIMRRFAEQQRTLDNMQVRISEVALRYRQMVGEQQALNLDGLSAEARELFQVNARDTLALCDRIAQMQSRVEALRTHFAATAERLRKIEEHSDIRQDEVIRTIFFNNELNFIRTLPHAGFFIRHWLTGVQDSAKLQFGRVSQVLPDFIIHVFGIFAVLSGIGLLIYRRFFKKTFAEKMPEMFTRRRVLQLNFMLFFFGLSLYWSTDSIADLDMTSWRQLALGVMMLAILRLALIFRLTGSQLKTALPVYRVTIIAYFSCMILHVMMVPYQPLIILSSTIGFLAFIFAVWHMRRWLQLQLFERIFNVCTVCNFGLAMLMGFWGFAYLSLTMMLAWFVVIALLQAIIGVWHFISKFVAVDAQYPIFNQILSRLIFPVGWIWLLVSLVAWLAETYHVEGKMNDWFNYTIVRENIASFSINDVLMVILVGIIIYFSITCFKLLLRSAFGESIEFGLLPSFMILGSYVVWAVYVIFALVVFNVQYSSMLVVLGGMSMGLGFGLKEIVENFIAGLILLVGQQVRPGDIVEISSDGMIGRVTKVTVRSTLVETYDGALITYPNSQVLTKDFRNWTSNSMIRRRTLMIGVAYGSDLDLVFRILLAAARETPGVLHKPAAEVLCKDFNSGSIDFEVRYWSPVQRSLEIGSELRRKIYAEFNANGISIPFPQLDVHIRENALS
jgi:small-conductance mechanosensitive channel